MGNSHDSHLSLVHPLCQTEVSIVTQTSGPRVSPKENRRKRELGSKDASSREFEGTR